MAGKLWSGSSREHAALVPLYLGIKGVLAKSFARIHKANLINCGIFPLVFADQKDYLEIKVFDDMEIKDFNRQLQQGNIILAVNKASGKDIKLLLEVTNREKEILLCGGYINYMKSRGE